MGYSYWLTANESIYLPARAQHGKYIVGFGAPFGQTRLTLILARIAGQEGVARRRPPVRSRGCGCERNACRTSSKKQRQRHSGENWTIPKVTSGIRRGRSFPARSVPTLEGRCSVQRLRAE